VGGLEVGLKGLIIFCTYLYSVQRVHPYVFYYTCC
jgi:hypothetical protein